MFSEIENVCCHQVNELDSKLNTSTDNSSQNCISETSAFTKICLDFEVLESIVTALKDAVAEKLESVITNK